VRLYLVCLDDPATAATYLDGVKDECLCKYVPAILKGMDTAPELACLEIGNWYCGLAETAPAAAKAAMLARARGYYVRFLELHMTDDLDRIKTAAALKKVEADLGGAAGLVAAAPKAPAAQGRWIDLLAALDLNKYTWSGKWERNGTAIMGKRVAAGKGRPRLTMPVVPQGSYELEICFVRIEGDNMIQVYLPVESTGVVLSISRHHGAQSGLELINGKGMDDNGTALKSGAIKNGQEYTLLCRVIVNQGTAQISVTLNGKPYVTWEGSTTSLSPAEDFGNRFPKCPGLGLNQDPVTFKSARLRMLSGEAKGP